MKLFFFSFLLAALSLTVLAATTLKPVIVTYHENTPDSVLEEAKEAVKSAGGQITHEYRLIKAFAARAPEKALETVETQGQKYNALVEEDTQVHADGT